MDAVAAVRDEAVLSLAEALAQLPDRQQPYTAMVERMSCGVWLAIRCVDRRDRVRSRYGPET
jgi:hypothetical protein